jgi:hypothetical protein
MLFSCQTSSLAVPQDCTTLGGQAAFTKLLKTRNHSRDFQFQADCFCLFSLDSGESDPVATLNHLLEVVELTGIEPVTSCLQSRRSPN